MDIFKMRCLVRASETLNFSQTAREMYISQSAVTQQVSSAEAEFNVKLFEKEGRKLQLTEAGSIIMTGLRSILNTYDSTVAQAQRASQLANELRIGYHGPMNWGTVPELLAAFKEQLPEIRLSVRTDHWAVLVHDLNEGLLDMVFTEQREMENYPQLSWDYLFRDGPCVCMSTRNPLSAKTVLYPEDLAGQNLIITDSLKPSSSMTESIDGLRRSGIDVDSAQYVNQPEIAMTMAAANIGVTFLPTSFKISKHPNLTYIDLVQDKFCMDMVLAYSEPRLTKAGSTFVQLCRDWNFRSADAETAVVQG